jgi:hypothetical protein
MSPWNTAPGVGILAGEVGAKVPITSPVVDYTDMSIGAMERLEHGTDNPGNKDDTDRVKHHN